MNRRSRGGSLGGGRTGSPMDRAADGMQEAGRALTAMYEAARQVLPEALARTDQGLVLAERAVVALERLARMDDPDAHCTLCGQRVDLHDGGRPCHVD